MNLRSRLRVLNILMMLGIVSPGCQPKPQDIEQLATNNICRLPETNPEMSQAGTLVPSESIWTGDSSTTPEILAAMDETNFSPVKDDMVNYIILPQNFQNPEALIDHTEILNKIFHPIGINIAFADRNLPVTIERIDQFAYLPDYPQLEAAQAHLQNIFPDNVVKTSVVIDSPDYMGSGGETPVASAYSEYSLFLIIHEISHNWGLYDVYDTSLSPYRDVHAELFLETESTGYQIANHHGVYDDVSIVPSPYNCNGEEVLTHSQLNLDRNIMGDWIPTNDEIIEFINNGGSIFNLVQERIMSIYIGASLNNEMGQINLPDLYAELYCSTCDILWSNFPFQTTEHDNRFSLNYPVPNS